MTGPKRSKAEHPPLCLTLSWILVLSGVAIFAVPAELDRQSVRSPWLAQLVPAPFRSFAQEVITVEALSSNDGRRALAETSELVRRRPVPEDNLAMLSAAAAKQGNYAFATRALYLAGGRGWRVPEVQNFAAAAAIDSQQLPSASYRLAALWKTRNTSDLTKQLTAKLVAAPKGRADLARLLVIGGSGVPDFLSWASLGLSSRLAGDTLQAMRHAGYTFNCVDMSQATQTLASRGRGEVAAAMWQSACGKPGGSSQMTLEFTPPAADGLSGPFDWTYPGSGGLEVAVTSEKGGMRLDYSNTDALRHTVATRLAKMGPGQHRVFARTLGDAKQALAVMLQIDCASNGGKPVASKRVPLAGGPTAFDIPARGCDLQTLTLDARPGSGSVSSIRVE